MGILYDHVWERDESGRFCTCSSQDISRYSREDHQSFFTGGVKDPSFSYEAEGHRVFAVPVEHTLSYPNLELFSLSIDRWTAANLAF